MLTYACRNIPSSLVSDIIYCGLAEDIIHRFKLDFLHCRQSVLKPPQSVNVIKAKIELG